MSQHLPPYEGLLCAVCVMDMLLPASCTRIRMNAFEGENYPPGEGWDDLQGTGVRVVEQARELLGLGQDRFAVNNTMTGLKPQTQVAGMPVCAAHLWPAMQQLLPKGGISW